MTHLVYGIDDKYLPPCLISVYSALRTVTGTVRVSIFTSGPDENIRKGFEHLAKHFPNARLEVRAFTTTSLAEYERTELAVRYPEASMIPLFIPWLIEGKCLFLDADTLVLRDISTLFETGLQGCLIGACRAPNIAITYRKHFHPSLDSIFAPARSRRKRREFMETADKTGFSVQEMTTKFFSSGVILMDTAAIRDADPSGDLMSENGAERNWAAWQDMDRLNAFFKDEIQYLDLRWNVCRDFNPLSLLYAPADLAAGIAAAAKDPGLLHFPVIFGRRSWRRPWYRNRKRYRIYRQVCEVFEETTGIPVIQMFNDRLESS